MPETETDYTCRMLPEDAGVVLEALGLYVKEAVNEGRGDDARRAFAAAGRVSDEMREAMFMEPVVDDKSDE